MKPREWAEPELLAYALKTIGPPDADALSEDETEGGGELAGRALQVLQKRLQELRDAAAAGKVTAARELHSLLKQVLARYEAMLRWSREAAASAGPASPAGKLAAAVQPKIIALRADLNWCEQLLV